MDTSFKMASEFQRPSWAGAPKPGLHLNVIKNDNILQKLLIDDKDYYLFGRNTETCDFPLQHQSCSRVHAALVHHKHLNRPFLIDLGSAHGTFIGSVRLEPNKPQQLFVDSVFSFGASTRQYTLKEKPQPVALLQDESMEGDGGTLLGITDLDNEVDDITQYNTAHNRQISIVGVSDTGIARRRHQRSNSVTFSETEEVINPEDVDPSVGRFRNLVQSSVVLPSKRRRDDHLITTGTNTHASSGHHPFVQPLRSPGESSTIDNQLYPDISPTTPTSFFSSVLSRNITSAPPVDNPNDHEMSTDTIPSWMMSNDIFEDDEMPRKKKYAKESWPGKKPSHFVL